MSTDILVVRVFLHDARYHGRPEWPPAPGRLFQALIAGASSLLESSDVGDAFRWLEARPAPVIAAPQQKPGLVNTLAVPNNDLDSKGGDPEALAGIRVMKHVTPRLLQEQVPFIYGWSVGDDRCHADVIVRVAEGLYQFGRGPDMAYAAAGVVDASVFAQHLHDHRGTVHHPSGGSSGTRLYCPTVGSFDSSQRRFEAQAKRFDVVGGQRVFVQAPKTLFRDVGYDCPSERLIFELRRCDDLGKLASVPATQSQAFVVACRDAVVERLTGVPGSPSQAINQAIVGRRPGEQGGLAPADRVRIIVLPSIGHEHTDPSIRRLLVDVPQSCGLDHRDVRWGFSGLELVDRGVILVEASNRAMLAHYQKPATVWSSVTPVALSAGRRRIDPDLVSEQAKGGVERDEEERSACAAVRQAFRQAGVRAQPISIEVQREPFAPRLPRAEEFAAPPRFSKHSLWHIRATFLDLVEGPLAIGNGRFLGLGLLAPAPKELRLFAWRFEQPAADLPIDVITAALRRAIIARAQSEHGPTRSLPPYITGHGKNGEPARDHRHLHFLLDRPRSRLLVVDPREAGDESLLQRAALGLEFLHVTRQITLDLQAQDLSADEDVLLGPSHAWESLTWYQVDRHRRANDAAKASAEDLRVALTRAGLPRPNRVEAVETRSDSVRGLEARLILHFDTPVAGPIMLGRSRHMGGGLFQHAID